MEYKTIPIIISVICINTIVSNPNLLCNTGAEKNKLIYFTKRLDNALPICHTVITNHLGGE